MEANRRANRDQEQGHNTTGTAFHFDVFGRSIGAPVGDCDRHNGSRDHPVDQAWKEQVKEFSELNQPLLLDHQGSDVAEGAKGTTGVCAHNDIDTGRADKAFVLAAHGHNHRTHQQRCRQVIRDRRDYE